MAFKTDWKAEALKSLERLKEQHQRAVQGSQHDLHEMKTNLAALELQVILMSMRDTND